MRRRSGTCVGSLNGTPEEPRRALEIALRVVAFERNRRQRLLAGHLENRAEQYRPPGDRAPVPRGDVVDLRRGEIAVGRGEVEVEVDRVVIGSSASSVAPARSRSLRRRRCRAPRCRVSGPAARARASSVTMMRAPEAPSGWPSAHAPPFTFTRSCASSEIVDRRHRDDRERFVDLEEIGRARVPARFREELPDRADRRGREPRRRLRMRRVADDARERRDAPALGFRRASSAPSPRRRPRSSSSSPRSPCRPCGTRASTAGCARDSL